MLTGYSLNVVTAKNYTGFKRARVLFVSCIGISFLSMSYLEAGGLQENAGEKIMGVGGANMREACESWSFAFYERSIAISAYDPFMYFNDPHALFQLRLASVVDAQATLEKWEALETQAKTAGFSLSREMYCGTHP
jgi:hypothetical protein